MARPSKRLTVAVTGPTGTFGFGLIPLLEADPQIERVIGIARRPFDPDEHGWSKMTYRQGDVRDEAALRTAFEGADVVVHLAFLVTGAGSAETMRSVNVDGTRNALRAAAAAGASRFVYASSAAAYGFHADNPVGITETWPTRPDRRFFYAEEKAELEHLLQEEAASFPGIELYLLRPPIVLGPHAVGAKGFLPDAFGSLAGIARAAIDRAPFAVPVVLPDLPVQFIHEDDVGQALQRCIVGAGPPGAYNIAGDGTVGAHDVVRALGLAPLGFPLPVAQRGARMLAALPRPPFLPPAAGWVTALSQPAIVDSTKAKTLLGWEPRFTGLEALRATVDPDPPSG
jgi:nucleoside-diphosphate-sugar epimerase